MQRRVVRIVLGVAVVGLGLTLAPAAPRRPAEPVSRVDALLQLRHDRAHARVGGLAFCFAPGTSEAYVEQVVARAATSPRAKAFTASDFDRWSQTASDDFPLAQGAPITLTWAVVPDGTTVPGDFGGPSAPSDLRNFLDGIYGSEANWLPLFQSVFGRWGELSGITYVHETADDGATVGSAAGRLGVRADIRIGGAAIDGPFGILAYNSFPNDGDMVIDTTDTFFSSTSQNSRRLRNVLSHEHGHGLGLDHVCPVNGTKLMEPTASLGFDGPQHDDTLGAQRLYGDRFEPNDGPGRATELVFNGNGKATVEDVGIDDDTDTDWYAFTGGDGTSVDITVRPIGRTYNEATQRFDGTCNQSTQVDTRSLVDLKIALLDSDGNVIVTHDGVGRGGVEELLDEPLPGPGSYICRVRGSGENDAQLYELVVKLVERGATPIAVDDDAETWEVTPISTAVLANDSGLTDGPISVRVTEPPVQGEVDVEGERIVYVPPRGFAGDVAYTYEVRDAHDQTASAVVSVTVGASPLAGNARIDGDGDGYSDEFESFRGTATADAASRPGEDITGGATPLIVTKAVLKLKPHKELADSIVVRGGLPVSEGYEPSGELVVVQVAGVDREFTLDAKGRAFAEEAASFRLRVKRKKGVVRAGAVRFDLVVKGGDFAEAFGDEGLATDRKQKKEPRAATIYLLFDGHTYRVTVPLDWSAKPGRTGKAKLVK